MGKRHLIGIVALFLPLISLFDVFDETRIRQGILDNTSTITMVAPE
jgi:hypothetical protein